MTSDSDVFDEFLRSVIELADETPRGEVNEEDILRLLAAKHGSRTDAAEVWEQLSTSLRTPVVRWGTVLEWNLFRKVVRVTRLLTAEEMERIEELYRLSTPEEVERRIRQLSGLQF